MQGAASVGVVAAATALTLRLNAMTGWIMWALSTFFRSLGVVAEGMETIAQPITLVDRPGARPLRLTGGRIEIARRSATTTGAAPAGWTGIDLTIAPGEKIGLVGRSGAGKSTLVKLLLRFYDAEGGRILIDGQDIAGVTQDSLRRADRHGAAGQRAAAPLGAREHPLRPARGQRGRDASRPPRRAEADGVHPRPAGPGGPAAATTPRSASAG